MSLESLVAQYGYIAVLFGTMVEGESIMFIAGYFSQSHYLELPWVFLCGVIGTHIGESFFYFLGRTQGSALLESKPAWKERSEVLLKHFRRHRYLLIVFYRFFYGMRSVAPLMIGASGVRPAVFLCLNIFGVCLWAGCLTAGGYYFGSTLRLFLQKVERYDQWVLLGFIVVLAGIGIFKSVRAHRKESGQDTEGG